MDRLFYTFQEAHLLFSGPLLSTTLTPIAPASDPNTLRQLLVDTNIFSVAGGVRGSIENSTLRLSKAEINAWVDIYVAYWKAIGETGRAESGKHRDDWAVRVYEAWKEVTNFVIRGYTSAGFAAWTLPCLYVAGKYLRVFAIKADEERGKQNGAGGGFREVDRLGDDIAANFEKNELLEDAARVINRIFTLCISDRYVTTVLSTKLLSEIILERRLRSHGNGAFTIRQTFFSKPTSRYIGSATVLFLTNY